MKEFPAMHLWNCLCRSVSVPPSLSFCLFSSVPFPLSLSLSLTLSLILQLCLSLSLSLILSVSFLLYLSLSLSFSLLLSPSLLMILSIVCASCQFLTFLAFPFYLIPFLLFFWSHSFYLIPFLITLTCDLLLVTCDLLDIWSDSRRQSLVGDLQPGMSNMQTDPGRHHTLIQSIPSYPLLRYHLILSSPLSNSHFSSPSLSFFMSLSPTLSFYLSFYLPLSLPLSVTLSLTLFPSLSFSLSFLFFSRFPV